MKEKKKKSIGYRDVLGQKEYCKMILASLINRFGDSIDAIAFTWIVYELTGNAVWSAVIFGANNVPSVLVTPLAGVWVEGRNKKRIMVVTDLIRGVCVALIATFYLTGILQAWMLLASTLIISTAEAFRGPANTALTPRLLKREYYEYGLSLHSTLSQVIQLIGMAAAGVIIGVIGVSGAIYIDMATFFASAGIILLVNTKEQKTEKVRFDRKGYMENLKAGFGYVKKRKKLCFMIGICVFLNVLVVPVNSLQAPLASEVLGGGAEILSILGVALTLGMIAGSAIYPAVQKRLSEKMIFFVSGMAVGVFYLGLIVCQPLYREKWFMYGWVTVLSVLFGVFVSQSISLANVALIKYVEEKYLARVGGITSAISMASMPVTSFLVSAVVGYTGTKWIFVIMGVISLLGGVFIAGSRALDEEEPQNMEEVPAAEA